MVFLMQAGFAVRESGIVQPKNVTSSLQKIVMSVSIGAICFWLLGYGFAFGEDQSGFIGDGFSPNTHIDKHVNNPAQRTDL